MEHHMQGTQMDDGIHYPGIHVGLKVITAEIQGESVVWPPHKETDILRNQ